MTDMTSTDPRPLYDDALTWVHGLLAGLDPARLDAPTPCTQYDVRALAGHLLATVERARVIGEGGDVFSAPREITGIPDDGWPAAFAAATDTMWTVWRGDDALLDRMVTVPWGTVPGCAALWGYLNEALVHGWDLAVATGQDPEADPQLATTVLAAAQRFLPPGPRGEEIPFADPVEPAPNAGPTERLANWSGRATP